MPVSVRHSGGMYCIECCYSSWSFLKLSSMLKLSVQPQVELVVVMQLGPEWPNPFLAAHV